MSDSDDHQIKINVERHSLLNFSIDEFATGTGSYKT